MSDAENPSSWEKYWQALNGQHAAEVEQDGQLDILERDINAQPDTFSHKSVFSTLIQALRAFSQDYFSYFNGLYQTNQLKSDDYPPEFVMRQVIDRIAEDVQVIQSCVDQRRLLTSGNAIAEDVLAKADKLAWAALRLAVDNGLLPDETTAITYFQKDTSIRVIPYASVALIGIPITCLNNPVDFLAIPHEVGHYVYWNSGAFPVPQTPGTLQKQNIRVYLKGAMKGSDLWLQRWIQEIFADTYGAIVAQGPIACSFQDLQNQSSKAGFTEDDTKHPLPIVRPDTYSDVIEKTNPDLATKLRARWSTLLQGRKDSMGVDSQGTLAYVVVGADPVPSGILFPEDVKANYTKVLTTIDSKDCIPLNQPMLTTGFPGRTESDPTACYTTFENEIANFLNTIDGTKLDRAIKTQTWADWKQSSNLNFNDPSVKVSQWFQLLLAGGWTTEGPQGRDLVD